MNIIDTFFYLTCRFLRKIGRNEDNSKWSTLMHTSLYVCLFIDSMIKLIGLVHNGFIIKQYTSLGFWGVLIIDLIAMVILYVRYYKYNILDKISNRYEELRTKKMIKILICILMICLPLLWFFISRAYISISV